MSQEIYISRDPSTGGAVLNISPDAYSNDALARVPEYNDALCTFRQHKVPKKTISGSKVDIIVSACIDQTNLDVVCSAIAPFLSEDARILLMREKESLRNQWNLHT